MTTRFLLAAAALLALSACADGDTDPIAATIGPDPALERPAVQTVPTVKTADPIGWAQGETPAAAEGLRVNAFAAGLDHPRWMKVLDNGDVLVAEAASEPSEGGGIKGFFANRIMKSAGAIEEPSPDRILLLRDADADGVAEERFTLIDQGLNQPFGLETLGGYLYIGNTDSLMRVPFEAGQTSLDEAPQVIARLPYNPGNNGHWTRNVAAAPDGSRLLVTVGSVSNAGESGMAVEENRAAIHSYAPDGSDMRLYATGLRNPVGLDFEPRTGAPWVAVNERDMLGDDLVPDYMTSVKEGGFYGWPWSYYGANLDPRFEADEIPAGRVQAALKPDYALGAHTASLGLHFHEGGALPARYRGGAFIGQHGSWNRSEFAGYKVIFVPFENGRPAGAAQDFLTGFLTEDGQAHGRPVGVATDQTGAILVADDVGDVIWRVSAAE